ncbi:hypothetical protein AAC387_Pa07g1501 [Persea americana]
MHLSLFLSRSPSFSLPLHPSLFLSLPPLSLSLSLPLTLSLSPLSLPLPVTASALSASHSHVSLPPSLPLLSLFLSSSPCHRLLSLSLSLSPFGGAYGGDSGGWVGVGGGCMSLERS